jgi:hypothetical protein
LGGESNALCSALLGDYTGLYTVHC